MENINNYIFKCIKEAVGTEKCCVELEGKSGKGEGNLGDVCFVKVTFNESNVNNTELHLVAKSSKHVPTMEEFIPFIFKQEMLFYTQVISIFHEFQREKNFKKPLAAFPKCYNTFTGGSTDSIDVIVLENLKIKGYKLHKRWLPLNHIKLVLTNYAKFHAISFAISDQRKDIFNKIETIYDSSTFVNLIKNFEEMYDKVADKAIKDLIEAERKDLADKYKYLKDKGIMKLIVESLGHVPKEKVVTHGDCHTNNFLFEYKNGDKETPSNVVFIDFQMSNLLSPMQDVGYLLYMVASKEEFSHFTELMDFYHQELSLYLTELGSDVNQLFPKSTMWEHWKKYTFFGFSQAAGFIELFYADYSAEDQEGNVDIVASKIAKDRKAYLERLVAIVDHFFNYN